MTYKKALFLLRNHPFRLQTKAVSFDSVTVHCEDLTAVQRPILQNAHTKSFHMPLWPHISDLNPMGTQWGMAGQCMYCMNVCVWVGLEFKEGSVLLYIALLCRTITRRQSMLIYMPVNSGICDYFNCFSESVTQLVITGLWLLCEEAHCDCGREAGNTQVAPW